MPNNIIMADTKGGEIPVGYYLKIHSKVCTIGDNDIRNTAQYQNYLMSLSGLPGEFMMFSTADEIVDPVRNDVACATKSGLFTGTVAKCYRYRDGSWSLTDWNSSSYDAVAVPGRNVVVYTWEAIAPT